MFAQLKKDCRDVVELTPSITVSSEKIVQFVETLKGTERWKGREHMGFPLRFDTLDAEVNFLAVRALLSFGSGYNKLLQAVGDRDADESVLFGVMSMFISGSNMDAEYFSHLSINEIASMFHLPLHREEDVESLPGVKLMKPHALKPFADLLFDTLTQTAETLRKIGVRRLSEFILHITKPEGSHTPSAADFVRTLCEAIPGFHDEQTHGELRLPFSAKAVRLAETLYMRFGEQDPARFKFSDMGEVSACADSRLVSVLHYLQIITLATDDLALALETAEAEEKGHELDVPLRAAVVVAVEELTKTVNTQLGWGVSDRDTDAALRDLAATIPNLHLFARRNIPLF